MENGYQISIVEALILASPEPLPGRRIAEQIEDLTPGKVGKAVADLNSRYYDSGCAYRIRELAGGYQFYILPEYAGYVDEMFTRRRKMRLTRAALETLAIIAYRQPVTKAEIEHIRGVASDGVLHNMLEKNMIAIKGRANTVGRPLQYGTTDEFLKFFGLASLDDLPKMSEIEELIKASEPSHEGQLSFEAEALDAALHQKLNVADGTFDPSTRNRDDDDVSGDDGGGAPGDSDDAASLDEPEAQDAAETERPSEEAVDQAAEYEPGDETEPDIEDSQRQRVTVESGDPGDETP